MLALDYLFKAQGKDEASQLMEEQALAFHHATAQLIFLMNQAWPNNQAHIFYLITG